ncbi:hypothetical protein C2S04_01880 [Helicobacter pylori]|nr:hypothetical protein C2S04_01880 [Helicobacter pylori]
MVKRISLNFLKEIKRFCNHFPQKLKGFFKKAGLSLSFGAFSCGYLKITACLVRDPYSFKQGFDSFLKTIINALLGQN